MTTTDTRELEQVLARTVHQLGEVQASALRAKLPKPFQRPTAELAAALGALADRGEVFRHPTAKTKFLAFDPAPTVRALLLEALGPKAMTEAELKRQVAKKGASLGLAKALGPLTSEALKALVREKTAFVHRAPPPPAESRRTAPKTLRYASVLPPPPELRPYVRKPARELKALVRTLAPFGATLAAAWKAFAIELGLAPPELAAGDGAATTPPGPAVSNAVTTTSPGPAVSDTVTTTPPGHAVGNGVTATSTGQEVGNGVATNPSRPTADPVVVTRPAAPAAPNGSKPEALASLKPGGDGRNQIKGENGLPNGGARAGNDGPNGDVGVGNGSPNGGPNASSDLVVSGGAKPGPDAATRGTPLPSSPPPQPDHPQPPADDTGRLLHALDEVAAREPVGSLLLVERVRERAGLDKAAFDRTALALAKAERIVLHYHDYPASLPPAELAQLVDDGRGTYFIGMARRRGA